jgi:cullin-associated NEDD8-dissociated protein 1
LETKDDAIKKRVIQTLGPLVVHLTDKQFTQLMDFVVKKIETADKHQQLIYNYLQTIGIISQSAGVRVGKFINKIMPQLERFCVIESFHENSAEVNQTLIELWENCMLTYEALILRCPVEIQPFVSAVVNIALQFIKYDPNYSYDDESSGAAAMSDDNQNNSSDWGEGEGDGWGDESENEQGIVDMNDTEDDDETWKVRRSAVRCLSAFIRAKSNILNEYYDKLCDTLIARFKERDANVKMAIFGCTVDLLHEAIQHNAAAGLHYEHKDNLAALSPISPVSTPNLARTRSSYNILNTKIRALVEKALQEGQSKQAKLETKAAVLSLIKELLLVKRGGLDEFLANIIPFVLANSGSEEMRLRSDSLILINLILQYHDYSAVVNYLPEISQLAISSVRDNYLKLKSESLRLISAIINILQPTNPGDRRTAVELLFPAVLQQLQLLDVDQETKEASLATMAAIVAKFGDELSEKLGAVLPIIMQRLSNELTRLSALRCITKMAQSPLNIDLSLILNNIIDELLVLLRKDSPALRHDTVMTLISLLKSRNSAQLNPAYYTKLLTEIAPIINDNDLFLSHLIFELISAIISANSVLNFTDFHAVFARILVFLKSPLLQGQALHSLVQLFQAFLLLRAVNYSELTEKLLNLVQNSKDYNHNSAMAIAQVIAGIIKSTQLQPAQFNAAIQNFLGIVQNNTNNENLIELSLLILGEIGREHNLANEKAIEAVIFSSFQAKSDNLKSAASYALGNITVGNLAKYLPELLELIKTKSNEKYLLLTSLKEVIQRHTVDTNAAGILNNYIQEILPILLHDAENSNEEGVRTECAECIGGLTVINTQLLLNQLIQLTQSSKPTMRAVAITALRYSLSNQSNIPLIQQHLQTFLALLKDPDLNVHRQSLLTMNALAHNNFELIAAELTKTILPILYSDMSIKAELIRVVDLGPFKHKVDDGLAIRKAAYQCLDTLLSVASHRLNIRELMLELRKGLVDADDIQIQSYELLYKLAQYNGGLMLETLDELPNEIMKGVKEQLKEAKGENNPERAKDVLRVAVRALYTISNIKGITACPQFLEFYQRVLKTALLAKMLEELHAN